MSNIDEVRKIKLCQLVREICELSDNQYVNVRDVDLDVINEYVLSQSGPFQCSFVNNIYTLIGHHDHMEVEAVLARPRVRAMALYDIERISLTSGSNRYIIWFRLVTAIKKNT